jgi:hypothetical protein
MEISRWRKPPVMNRKLRQPRQGDGMGSHDFRSPCRGCGYVWDWVRWLAPPANIREPSGICLASTMPGDLFHLHFHLHTSEMKSAS